MEIMIRYRGNQNDEGGHYVMSTTVEVADKDDAELQGQEFGMLICHLISGINRGELASAPSST